MTWRQMNFIIHTQWCMYCYHYLYISPYRFGPGMVIYWFGYVKEIDVHAEDGIIVHSTFAA